MFSQKSSMKKNILLITVTLALALSWVGCNKAGKLDKASTFEAPSGPMELKLKWPVGERVVQNFDMKMNMEISVPNQPGPIKQDMNMGQKYALSVLNETADGGREVELEFLSARIMMVMGGKTMMEYDSTQKPSKDGKGPMTTEFQKTFQQIIGSKIQYFLDASNHVERIEGVDALVNRLTTGGPGDATSGIKSMFNEGYFKQIIGDNRYLPSKPVQPGDTWPVQLDMPMGGLGTMEMNYNFTFQNWERHGKRTCARLEFQGTVKTKPDQNSKPAGMTMTIQDGNVSGVSWFDPELGTTIETTLNQDIKMTMTINMNQHGKAITQTMTNVMNQTISMKLDSVK
jgi:hypothetical protein